MECSYCYCLQVPDLTWLDLAYADEAKSGSAGDSGRFRRNYSAFLYLSALKTAGLFGDNPRFLDFGGGSGLLTQMLIDTGNEAWLTDPHIGAPPFAAERHLDLNSLKPHIFDVVTALEVFEHLTDPISTGRILNGLLKPSGSLVISTEIYCPDVHTSSWPYLAPSGGQHITFWSKKALYILLNALSFESLGFFPGESGFMLVFSHLSEEKLLETLAQAHSILCNSEYTGRALAAFDFRSDGIASNSFGILGKL